MQGRNGSGHPLRCIAVILSGQRAKEGLAASESTRARSSTTEKQQLEAAATEMAKAATGKNQPKAGGLPPCPTAVAVGSGVLGLPTLVVWRKRTQGRLFLKA